MERKKKKKIHIYVYINIDKKLKKKECEISCGFAEPKKILTNTTAVFFTTDRHRGRERK